MGLELQNDPPSSPSPAAEPQPERRGRDVHLALSVDLLALALVGWLIYSGRVTPAEGLPWLAALLAGRLPTKRHSGVATILAGWLPWR